MNDLELLDRLKKGEQKAFTEVVSRYRYIILWKIYSIVGNYCDAEDLTMETFEKAFENIQNFTPRYKMSSWLLTIARNNAINFVRTRNRRPASVELDLRLSDAYLNPEEQVITSERKRALNKMVRSLRPRVREVVIMRSMGYKYDEISEKLDIPSGTMKNDLFQARQLLKQAI